MPDGASSTLLDRLLRPGRNDARAVRADLWCLIGLGCLLIGAGLGLREPWPPDEPRFALIARDMLATGDWLVPRVAGDIYTQKPPLYCWLMAASMALTTEYARWALIHEAGRPPGGLYAAWLQEWVWIPLLVGFGGAAVAAVVMAVRSNGNGATRE